MATPSTVTCRFVALSWSALAHLHKSDSVFKSGVDRESHSTLRDGKKMAFPAGMLHTRVTSPPPVPAKNHTLGSF